MFTTFSYTILVRMEDSSGRRAPRRLPLRYASASSSAGAPGGGALRPGHCGGRLCFLLANLATVLSARGLGLADIVKTSVFLKNFADFARMNAVYAEVFGAHRPARTTVEVSRLPLEALVEIECIAVLPSAPAPDHAR